MASGSAPICNELEDMLDDCIQYSVGGADTIVYLAPWDAVANTVVLDPVTGAVTNITFNAGYQKFTKVQVQLDQTLATDSSQGGDQQGALNRLHSVVMRIPKITQAAKNFSSQLERNRRGWVAIIVGRFNSDTTGQKGAWLYGHYNGMITPTLESTLGQAQTDLPGITPTLSNAQPGFAPEIVPDPTTYPNGIFEFINAMLENPA